MGTRLSEETESKPKPMVEIGGLPMIWHIMKIYSAHGVNTFVICLGHKGYVIKEYFANYALHMADVTFDVANGSVEVHQRRAEPWKVTLVDTGQDTQTGGRIERIAEHVEGEDFCLTYGDGVADVDVTRLLAFHRERGRLVTVTAVRPPGRFGALEVDGDLVSAFREKPLGDGGWINGGFFVVSPDALDRIEGDQTAWEDEPLEGLAKDRQLAVYRHDGFWHAMDTLRDRRQLEAMWTAGRAPWKVW
jgi:glucose-1-phosphate cytidylyltransferase